MSDVRQGLVLLAWIAISPPVAMKKSVSAPMSKSKSWSQVVSGRNAFQDGYAYNEENEVYTKMPEKRSDPEYIDVKFNWVPADFPDGRIKGVLERLYGEIRYSRIMKDRRGKADGRRM